MNLSSENEESHHPATMGLFRYLRSHNRLVALIILLLAAVSFFMFSNSTPKQTRWLSDFQSRVNFQLFYPNPLPPNYTYDSSSAVVENRILFFNLKKGVQLISISEQAAPTNPPDVDKLKKSYTDFTDINTLAGKGIVGVVNGVPVGILVTNTTLVSINATTNVPKDVVANIAQNMSSLAL